VHGEVEAQGASSASALAVVVVVGVPCLGDDPGRRGAGERLEIERVVLFFWFFV
jgi:hypothetical protein